MLLNPLVFLATVAASAIGQPTDDFTNIDSHCTKVIALPEPTGPNHIGTSTFHFVDQARAEDGTADANDRRQIIFQLWYPAIGGRDATPVAYVPELETFRAFFSADSRDIPQKISRDLANYGCVLTHSYRDLPASDLSPKYPVLVFSPGGNMSRHWHTALAEEFASRGYVVLVLSHALNGLDAFPGLKVMAPERWALPKDATPDQEAANDNAMSEELARDARFALDRLSDISSGAIKHPLNGRIDMTKVAIAGHSRGGNTVARGCSTDPRFKACITYDNIGPDREEKTGLKTPQLTVRTSWSPDRKEELRSYLNKNPTTAEDVEITGATHFTFTDLQIVDPENYKPKLDPVKGLRLAEDITDKFIRDVFAQKVPELSSFAMPGAVEVWRK